MLDAFLICMLALTFITAYYPVWTKLISTWISSGDYSHGFFVVPVVGYLVYSKRMQIRDIPCSDAQWNWALVIGSLCLYIFSLTADIKTLTSYSMILFIASAIILIQGWGAFKLLLFPWFFLFFMVPVPAQIYASLTVPLQLLVSKFSVDLAAVSGLTVFREGNVIYLPNHTMEVVEACSGLRSLMSLLALTALFAYLSLNSHFTRIFLFASALPIAIGVNIVRVLLIITAYILWNIDLTIGGIHLLLGGVIFVLALLLVYILQRILKRWERVNA